MNQRRLKLYIKSLSILLLSLSSVLGFQKPQTGMRLISVSLLTSFSKQLTIQAASSTQQKPLTNSWRGLTPLSSTRKDVEKLLGSHRDSVGQTYIYDAGVEIAHITYSTGACKDSVRGRWNVPIETVLEIRIYPRTDILVHQFEPLLDKYKRVPDPNISHWAFYFNDENGVTIQTNSERGSEFVEIITLGPAFQNKNLRCLG